MQRAVDLSELVTTVIRDDATKRGKYQKPAGFELTVNAQLLTTKEAQVSFIDAFEFYTPFLDPKAFLQFWVESGFSTKTVPLVNHGFTIFGLVSSSIEWTIRIVV